MIRIISMFFSFLCLSFLLSCKDNSNLNVSPIIGNSNVVIDTTFTNHPQKLKLKITRRDDLTNRKIFDTYQCENTGSIVEYGHEFIVELGYDDSNNSDINYINMELIEVLARKRRIEKDQILSETVTVKEIRNGKIIVEFVTHQPAMLESTNFVTLGIDIMTPQADHCKRGGISFISITNPWED